MAFIILILRHVYSSVLDVSISGATWACVLLCNQGAHLRSLMNAVSFVFGHCIEAVRCVTVYNAHYDHPSYIVVSSFLLPPSTMSTTPVSRPSRFRVQSDTVLGTAHIIAQLTKDVTDIAKVPFASEAASLVLSLLEVAKVNRTKLSSLFRV